MRHLLGIYLIGLGSVVFFVALFAFFDPAGTKMADDMNPFGPPTSRTSSVMMGFVGFAAVVGGWKLMIRRKAKEPNKAMETTPVDVTISAAQKVAPSTSVSHL